MPSRYRDTKTGRLVSKATWKRSMSGRYKRERIIAKPKTETPRLKPSKKRLPTGKPARKPAKKKAPRKGPVAPLPPEPEQPMFRATVSAPFFERTGKRDEYKSMAARTTAFYPSESDASEALDQLEALTEEARENYMEVNEKTWIVDESLNVQIQGMSLDPERMGTVETLVE